MFGELFSPPIGGSVGCIEGRKRLFECKGIESSPEVLTGRSGIVVVTADKHRILSGPAATEKCVHDTAESSLFLGGP